MGEPLSAGADQLTSRLVGDAEATVGAAGLDGADAGVPEPEADQSLVPTPFVALT